MFSHEHINFHISPTDTQLKHASFCQTRLWVREQYFSSERSEAHRRSTLNSWTRGSSERNMWGRRCDRHSSPGSGGPRLDNSEGTNQRWLTRWTSSAPRWGCSRSCSRTSMCHQPGQGQTEDCKEQLSDAASLTPPWLCSCWRSRQDFPEPTCTKEQVMVPLLSWLSRVSQTATSGTLVTPSVIIIMPGNTKRKMWWLHKVILYSIQGLLRGP